MSNFSNHSLQSFETQYLSSASAMCQWLDTQLSSKNLGVHAALRALAQIVDDVDERFVGICGVCSEGIGVRYKIDEGEDFWRREVGEIASFQFANLPGVADTRVSTGDSRHVIAKSLIRVHSEVGRLRDLGKTFEMKWTGNDSMGGGEGYTPSTMYGKAGGVSGGVFETVLGSNNTDGFVLSESDKNGAKEDAEMWDALKELTDTEEQLLVKWRGVAVTKNKELLERQNYMPSKNKEASKAYLQQQRQKQKKSSFSAPTNASFSRDRKNSTSIDIGSERIGGTKEQQVHEKIAEKHAVLNKAVTYHPHPIEHVTLIGNKIEKEEAEKKKLAGGERRRLSSVTASLRTNKENEDRESTDSASKLVIGDETIHEILELQKLKKLASFRQNSRQELYDSGSRGGKYGVLKFGGEEGEGTGDSDDEDEVARKSMVDIFAVADESTAARNEKIRRAESKEMDESYGKFPFRLSRYTINDRCQPARLWNGTSAACDVSPLVDSTNVSDSKEVSTVCLVVPTEFAGNPRGGTSNVHRLMKRASKPDCEMNANSPSLEKADMEENSFGSGTFSTANKQKRTPLGQPRELIHQPEPEHASDIDIRRFANNWGGYLGFNL